VGQDLASPHARAGDPQREQDPVRNRAPGSRQSASRTSRLLTDLERSGRTIDAAWAAWWDRRDLQARERLVLHYLPIVKLVAKRVRIRGTLHGADDFVSYGAIGLMDAIEKFDPSFGARFETYAMPRIRGAMIDSVRQVDWVPRSVRSKSHELERAQSRLQHTLRRTPGSDEIAAELDVTRGALAELRSQLSRAVVEALDEPRAWTDSSDGTALGDRLPDRAGGPADEYEDRERNEVLAGAINRMADRQRLVVILYFYQGLTQREIGDVLGLTESRICQLLSEAVEQLRVSLTKFGFDGSPATLPRVSERRACA
jgi:RNA polymerase sigma factor for flagellar operon FliA